MQKVAQIVICIGIFLLAFVYRAQEVWSHNFLFLEDQGRDMMAVRNIVFSHHVTLIGPYTSLQGVFQGPLWYYLLAIPTILTHGDPWGAVVLMLILSLDVIVVAFLWTKKLFGFTTACIVAGLLALCPEAIASATFAWNPHPMWLLLLLFIFVLYTSLLKNKFVVLLWPLLALMFHFETAMGVVMVITTISFLLLFHRNVLWSTYSLLGALLGSVFFLPQIIFDLRHNFLMTRSVLRVLSGSNQGLIVRGEHTGILALLPNHITELSTNLLASTVSIPFLSFMPVVLLLMSVGVIIWIRGKNEFFQQKRFSIMIMEFVILFIFFELLYPFPLRYWFITGFEVFYILFIGVSLGILAKNTVGKGIVGMLFALFLIVSVPHIYAKYQHPDYGGVAKFQGKMDAVKYVYIDSHSNPSHLLVFTPAVYTDPYDYLIWWYSYTHHLPMPDTQKKGTLYLLMEPDPYKPWSYKGWLETVVKSGKVQKTTLLPSGLIVQKRREE